MNPIVRRGLACCVGAALVVLTVKVVQVPATPWQWVPVFAAVLAVTLWFVKDLQLCTANKALIVGGVALRLVYMAKTPWWIRSYDIDGHFPYIEYIVANLSLPPADWGWESFQPPLYYLTAAVVWKIGSWAGIEAPAVVLLRLLSIACNVGFLVFGLKTQELVLHRSPLKYLAAALLVFWPELMIWSSPISNDSLYFMLYAAAVYYLVRAMVVDGHPRLRAALLCAGLATATKFTGVTLFPIIVIAVWIRHWRDPPALRRVVLACALTAALSVPVSLGNNVYTAWSQGREIHIVGNIEAFDKRYPFRVGNRADDYLTLDVRAFLAAPWMSPWDDSTARRNYWNYLLKTSLFATFYFDPALEADLSRAMSLLLLLLVAYLGLYFIVRRRSLIEPAPAALVATGVILLAASITGRFSNPFCSMADFRYVMPILIPATILAVDTMATLLQGRSMLARGLGLLGCFSGTLFVLGSIVFWSIMW